MTEMAIDVPAMLEGLNEAALIAAGGRVRAANAAARALLGEGIEGAELSDVISHPAALEALERRGPDAPESVELTGLGRSRRRHWLMRSAPLADGTSLIRFVDRSEARAAEQMRVDFVANASHELRTPLSTLIGYTETLREQADEIDWSRAIVDSSSVRAVHGGKKRAPAPRIAANRAASTTWSPTPTAFPSQPR